MILAQELSFFLKRRGIHDIYIKKVKRRGNSYLQDIAVNVLLKDLKLKEFDGQGKLKAKEEGIRIFSGKGNEKVGYEISKNGRESIEIDFPRFPIFIIDLSLWDRHFEEERNRLLLQLTCSINSIRKYLWDYNLSINNPPSNFSIPFLNKIRLNVVPEGNTIILNPYGEMEATEELIRNTQTFIIGGIIDRSGWRFATYEMAKIAKYDFPHVKIALRGSTVGVPDRINKIIEIILHVYKGERLENAILDLQSNADKFNRLLVEKQKGNLKEAIQWLKPSDKVLRRLGIQSNSA
ncbi:tRNA (adenine(9)-N1)-methyltransferase Trm10 [Acidianus sp. HS-5]|uniref:tRNA (adenine(9)-N1)-methyltransferase Trm10 n=1 Tax=Acidianus sp. HS-5 TaxID=2886040 RepID=UPI001F2C3098|nr:tRNA (adenine(9)-N1)-methyltransferase Trm10 [Acidianus sp. HS-5]BDC19409.1 tRNA methyltransferase [Acidianus sp. HS-5]